MAPGVTRHYGLACKAELSLFARAPPSPGAAQSDLDPHRLLNPIWPEALGYARPDTEQVRIGLGYAPRTYRLPADALGGDLAVVHSSTPAYPRGGAMLQLEDGRWMLTLGAAFLGVTGLVISPQSLLRPGVVLRVLRAGRQPGTGSAAAADRDAVRAALTWTDHAS